MTNEHDKKIPVEISARHLHLSQEHQDALFGAGYAMKILKELSQTGQWAAEETLLVKGPKGALKCRVLGPCRKQTQVELASTDGHVIGVKPSVRLSGDLAGSTGGVTLVGPAGEVALNEGVINDIRHLHISDDEAAALGVKQGDKISVRIDSETPVTFHDVHVRVHPSFRMNVHLDTDEGNAASLGKDGGQGRVVEIISA